ncbi:hypothetical protein BDZ91DRAFT_435451 [Kalaharituber pfeilii]|nr:hypothetical protein BDZ91DRAFT_435451 [Kalaharituber pfeilii]
MLRFETAMLLVLQRIDFMRQSWSNRFAIVVLLASNCTLLALVFIQQPVYTHSQSTLISVHNLSAAQVVGAVVGRACPSHTLCDEGNITARLDPWSMVCCVCVLYLNRQHVAYSTVTAAAGGSVGCTAIWGCKRGQNSALHIRGSR